VKKCKFPVLAAAHAVAHSVFTSKRRPRVAQRGVLPACMVAALLLSSATSRAIDFDFFYADPDGEGFFDPVDGAQRRAAMQAAGDAIGRLIIPSYGGETVTVRVYSQPDPDPNSNVLANANASFFYDSFSTASPSYIPDTHYPKALADHLHGADVDPGQDAIHINVNTAQAFYYGTDGNPAASFYDFVSVATHELIHGLGFASTFREEGGYGFFGDGTYDSESGRSGLPTIFDRYVNLGGSGDNRVLALSTDDRVAALTSGNLFWFGLNGRQGNNGNAPPLFAPDPYEKGSSVSHTNIANDLMRPGIGTGTSRSVSAVDRGILRDMGWNISVFSSTVNWTPAGVNNRASTLNNWSQNPYPGDTLSFSNNAAGVFDVRMDLQLYQLDQITFTVTAPAYTLRLSSFVNYDLIGFGIENDGIESHTFVLESHADEFSPIAIGSAAVMGFNLTATASNSIFEVHGGYSVPQHTPTDHYDRFDGAQVNFFDTSTAANATFNIQGAAGDGATFTYARVNFVDASYAGMATFNNQPGRSGQALDGQIVAGFGGRTIFHNTASAGMATFNNFGQDVPAPGGSAGVTNFLDSSTASEGVFHNLGATAAVNGVGIGGATQFFNDSTASLAGFANHPSAIPHGGGNTYFGDDSSAGNAVLDNLAEAAMSGGTTTFYDHSTAGHARIDNRGTSAGGVPGITSFHGDSGAGTANIHNYPGTNIGGRTEFYDHSSAATANIIIEPAASLAGTVAFYDDSSAGDAHITAGYLSNSEIVFNDQSTAGSAVIDLQTDSHMYLRFNNTASAGNAEITAGDASNTVGLGSQIQVYGNSTASTAHFTMHPKTQIAFADNATAGNAVVHLLGSPDPLVPGGSAVVFGNASAGNATFIVDGAPAAGGVGGELTFDFFSNAANATIILHGSSFAGSPGGSVGFTRGAGANLASFIAEAGSIVNISQNSPYGGTAMGSIEGDATIYLGDSQLTVGALDLSTTFNGPLVGYINGGSLVKFGAGALKLTGNSSYGGGTTVNGGSLSVDGSIVGNANVNSGATLQGIGSVGGLVTIANGGAISPGNSAGTLAVGSLALNSGSQTKIELGGLSLGTQYDDIVSSGGVDLGGTLSVSLINGFTPELGNQFTVLTFSTRSGDFDSYTGLNVGGHLSLRPSFAPTSLLLTVRPTVDGDVNMDGTVNIFDINSVSANWSTAGPPGDANGDGVVNIFDINLISSNWGATDPGSAQAVPEPASIVLLCCGAVGVMVRGLRHGRRLGR
jgi:autotransporter-associated beta strand protein